ncbi:MAG: hypothetical protein AB7H88_12975 [Vicinamibacterales bacterium]
MEDRLARLEADMASLVRRLEALEAHAAAGTRVAPAAVPGVAAAPRSAGGRDLAAAVPALGRALIGLGVAYLLRGLTDMDLLPPAAGVPAGGLLAAGWWWVAVRAARRADGVSAAFASAVGVLIAFPLIAEATYRFALWPAPAGAAVLAAMTAALLVLAGREGIRSLAWLTVVGSLGTAVVLMARTGQPLPYTAHVVVVGVGALWLGYAREWIVLRWPAALVADLLVAALVLRARQPEPLDPPAWILAVQVFFVAAYLGSIAARTIVRGRAVIPFEVVQTAAVLVVGLGGGLVVSRAAGAPASIGWVSLGLGAAAYAVAFAFLGRRGRGGINFFFYGGLGLVMVVVAGDLLLAPPARAAACAALAVVAALAAGRFGRVSLDLHAVVYLLAAATWSALPADAARQLFGGAPLPAPGPVDAVVWLGAAAVLWRPVPADGATPARVARVGRQLVAALAVAGAAGAAAWAGAAVVAAALGEAPAGHLATVRTVVLAVAVVLTARLAALPRFDYCGVLVYPLLAVAGLKLVVQDLRQSAALALFVALAAYGAALLVAPRLAAARAGATAPARLSPPVPANAVSPSERGESQGTQ